MSKGEDEVRVEPKRILIVDDEELARRRVARYLAKYLGEARIDCRIAEAGTGLEAVELIESFRPEIIFLDIEMPGLDGFEVLSQFSVLLPLTVIADQLGVSRADLAKFKRWTDGFTAQLSGMASGEDAREAVRRIVEFQRYFAARVEEAKRRLASSEEKILSIAETTGFANIRHFNRVFKTETGVTPKEYREDVRSRR